MTDTEAGVDGGKSKFNEMGRLGKAEWTRSETSNAQEVVRPSKKVEDRLWAL